MTTLYISSNTTTVSLAKVMSAKDIYLQHMTSQELRDCFLKPSYNNGDLASVLLTVLEKAGLTYETVPNGSLVITTCYGEPCVLEEHEIFGTQNYLQDISEVLEFECMYETAYNETYPDIGLPF